MNIETKTIKLSEIRENPDNPRFMRDDKFELLVKSLRDFPEMTQIRKIVVDENMMILGGNYRFKALKELKAKTVTVELVHGLTEEQKREFIIKDNASWGDWNFDMLQSWDTDLLKDWGVEIPEDWASGISNDMNSKTESKNSLHEKFLLPPFSVLNARSGEWQERKKQWLSLGIKSEISRESMTALGSLSGTVPRYYDFKEDCEKRLDKKLSNKEFEQNYLHEYTKDSTLAYTNDGGMISIFDPVLCEIMYSWFCPKQGKILDPFAGGSVRGIVSNFLGFDYTGIDLRAEQIEANIQQAKTIIPESIPKWLCGNSLKLSEIVSGMFDFIFSCPPYFDLEVYSESSDDLSNYKSYEAFVSDYKMIVKASVAMLKDNRFACFVVGDIRDKKGFYRNFVSDTIEAFQSAGMTLYNEAVLVTCVGSLPIRVTKQFRNGRKLGKTHQNILIFYKGNPKNIRNEFGDVEIADIIMPENE